MVSSKINCSHNNRIGVPRDASSLRTEAAQQSYGNSFAWSLSTGNHLTGRSLLLGNTSDSDAPAHADLSMIGRVPSANPTALNFLDMFDKRGPDFREFAGRRRQHG